MQRFRDWQNERRIRRLADKLKAAHAAGDRILARFYWRLMVDAINTRSARQIERMDRHIMERIRNA
ncbi:hypothetical protein ACFCQI_01725 [Rhodanobacter sp. FW102-FHT14D06]|uniref:Uncharacterized protein n=2 Tax=unclassified Rhodanobacter TaxID=2621553 RepID=A0AB74UQV6_9GAMM